jgi:hypothetical protein
MTEVAPAPAAPGQRDARWLAVPLLAFAFFSLSAGLLARHQPPSWIGRAHRWSGRLAFLFALPVAYHCIFKLGFQRPDGRVLAHSLFGCAVYGAFAAKVTIVRLHRFPKFVLPLAGGVLFAVLVGVWYTSAIPASANAAAGATVFRSAGCGGVTPSRPRARAARSARTSTPFNRPICR